MHKKIIFLIFKKNYFKDYIIYILLLLKYIIKFSIVSLSFLDSLSKPAKEYSIVMFSLVCIYSLKIWSRLIFNTLQILIKTSYDGFDLSCSMSLMYLTDTSISSANFS